MTVTIDPTRRDGDSDPQVNAYPRRRCVWQCVSILAKWFIAPPKLNSYWWWIYFCFRGGNRGGGYNKGKSSKSIRAWCIFMYSFFYWYLFLLGKSCFLTFTFFTNCWNGLTKLYLNFFSTNRDFISWLVKKITLYFNILGIAFFYYLF